MAKFRTKLKKSTKSDKLTSQDLQEEKGFFKVAIIVTLVLLILVYLVYSGL